MALELPGWVVTAFNVVGLPWPGIDEDQLRAWATSVRSFASEMSGSSARSHSVISELAGASASSVTSTLVSDWEHRNQLVADLHGPLDDFAEALDVAADVVVAQKLAVIAAATAFATEFAATQIGAIFTLGLDEAALPAELISTREIVQFALDYLENWLTGQLLNMAMRAVTDHVSGFLAQFLDDTPQLYFETQSLKMSYSALRNAASTFRGQASQTEETGDAAYSENASRDIEDDGEGGDDAGDGGGFAAVVQALEQGLLELAQAIFKGLAQAIAKIQSSTATILEDLASRAEDTDQSLGDDGPKETGQGPAVVPPGGPPPSFGKMSTSSGNDGLTLTDTSEAPGAADPADTRVGDGDPVDVATGEVLLAETDVTLPGALPLVLQRTHRSSHRTGRWFGRSWVSSFDQRLQVTPDRVIGAFADGRVLTWTNSNGSSSTNGPGDNAPLLPVTGSAWPLRRNPDGSYAVTDPQRGLTWRFERHSGYQAGPGDQGELPLVSLTDRAGNEVVFHYDVLGHPVAVTHSGGYRIQVATADGRVAGLTLTGRDGHDDMRLVSYSYDAAGNLSGVVNSSGQPLRFSYDAAGRLTEWRDRNDRYYRYSYDAQGRCVRGEGPGDALSGTFSYQPGLTRWTDAGGAVTSYQLTDSAHVAAITDPLGNTTRLEHDSRGRVSTRIDPLGRITRYAYDAVGNIAAVTRPDGSQATTEYDERGLLVAVTGPDGATWRQEHDERGNRTALIAPDGTVTRFGYDAAGHLASITDPADAVTRITADAAGLPVAVTSPAGRVSQYARDSFGRVTAVTAPDGAVTRLSWTAEGRLAARTFPDGASESWTYDGDGNLLSQLSAVGESTAYEYGPFSQLTGVTRPDGTRTRFGYDHQLRLTSVTHGGLDWRYSYDAAGRLTAETDYNAATTNYAYDPAGQLASVVNAVGQRVTFGYDELGNQTERVADGTTTTFEYDPVGLLVRAVSPDADLRFERDALGQVTAETCNGRTVTSEYDAAGRLVRRVTPSGSVSDWAYDPDGKPAVMTAGRHELRFGYDQFGRETRRHLPGGLTLSQAWDQRGRLTLQALTGADAPRPEGPALSGELLARRAYAYRGDGLVTGIEDLLAGNRTIGLDPGGRVVTVTGTAWAEQYAYDLAGNITAALWPAPPGIASPAWPDAEAYGQREVSGTLTSRAGGVRYRHDGRGRVVQRQRTRVSRKPDTWQYEWDADDRLTAVTTPDGSTWRYRYDPLGRRIAKEHLSPDGDVTERTAFAWHGAALVEQQTTPAGAGQRSIITWDYRPGTFAPLTQAERTGPHAESPDETARDEPGRDETGQAGVDERFYAIITDLVGTPAELVAADGTLAGRQVHTLWGGTAWAAGGAATPLRFPGQYEDPETGLHYNNQRYYDPASGSYLTPDPLGLAPAPNPHAYVSNPQVLSDPLGLDPGYKTVYRFHDASDPLSLRSRLGTSSPEVQARVAAQMRSPAQVAWLAHLHMRGQVQNSPFVSVTDDPDAAANSTDPWLRTIVTGEPGAAGAARAPDLSEFKVPVSRLIPPSNALSISEGEYLFTGDDLINYLVKTRPNPYGRS